MSSQAPGSWENFTINTQPAEGFPAPTGYADLTPMPREKIPAGMGDGQLHVFIPHTTCTRIFNSGVDGTTLADIRLFIESQVRVDRPFVHLHDGPQDAAAHVRLVFGTNSLSAPVIDGQLAIGQSQGIYLLELDGPRDRTIHHAASTVGLS